MSSDLGCLSGVGFSEEAEEVKHFRPLQSKVILKTKVDLGRSHFRLPVKIPPQGAPERTGRKKIIRLCSAEVPTVENYQQSKGIQRKAARS